MDPTNIEKRFVYWLTAICWWIDIKLNKNTVWCSFAINFFVVFLLNILVYFTIEITEHLLLQMTLDTFLSPFLFYFFACMYNNKDRLIENTKKSPNPNIYGEGIFHARIEIIMFILFTPTLFYFGNMFYLAVIVAAMVSFYVLCVDRIPPYEKEKRLHRSSSQKLVLSS